MGNNSEGNQVDTSQTGIHICTNYKYIQFKDNDSGGSKENGTKFSRVQACMETIHVPTINKFNPTQDIFKKLARVDIIQQFNVVRRARLHPTELCPSPLGSLRVIAQILVIQATI